MQTSASTLPPKFSFYHYNGIARSGAVVCAIPIATVKFCDSGLCGQVRYVRGEAVTGASQAGAEVELMLVIGTKWGSLSVLWPHPPPSIV